MGHQVPRKTGMLMCHLVTHSLCCNKKQCYLPVTPWPPSLHFYLSLCNFSGLPKLPFWKTVFLFPAENRWFRRKSARLLIVHSISKNKGFCSSSLQSTKWRKWRVPPKQDGTKKKDVQTGQKLICQGHPFTEASRAFWFLIFAVDLFCVFWVLSLVKQAGTHYKKSTKNPWFSRELFDQDPFRENSALRCCPTRRNYLNNYFGVWIGNFLPELIARKSLSAIFYQSADFTEFPKTRTRELPKWKLPKIIIWAPKSVINYL